MGRAASQARGSEAPSLEFSLRPGAAPGSRCCCEHLRRLRWRFGLLHQGALNAFPAPSAAAGTYEELSEYLCAA